MVWNENSKLPMDRDDVISYPIPMTKIARGINPKLAKLITNIVYVGALAEILGIEQSALESAVARQFKGKDSAIELNTNALNLGREYFRENLAKSDPYNVEAREIKTPQFFVEGNAVALGALFGGAQLLSWYPITPSSSLAEGMINWIPKNND